MLCACGGAEGSLPNCERGELRGLAVGDVLADCVGEESVLRGDAKNGVADV